MKIQVNVDYKTRHGMRVKVSQKIKGVKIYRVSNYTEQESYHVNEEGKATFCGPKENSNFDLVAIWLTIYDTAIRSAEAGESKPREL